jgi:HKD family nuclease
VVHISFLRPVDQPSGQQRFLNELRSCLGNADYTVFRFAVAFAKAGPFFRLDNEIQAWKARGGTIEAIFGIDHLGTSYQVLQYALQTFSRVYITHVDFTQSSRITFHPKMYLFYGQNHAVCYVGSHNMTTGGTETNFEAGVKIEMDLSKDQNTFDEALSLWESILPDPNNEISTLELDDKLLQELTELRVLLDEELSTRVNLEKASSSDEHQTRQGVFPRQKLKPASAIPKSLSSNKSKPADKSISATASPPIVAQVFVIQVILRKNGEIRLSYNAVNQNPDFFEYPFSGVTTPKIASNESYPQRDPDPVVDVFVYDESGDLSYSLSRFNLNTVDYRLKSEIRITFPPNMRPYVPDFSMLVMEKSSDSNLDYIIRIYAPGSQAYNDYLANCNQELPSGGKPVARKMGWL